MTEDPSALREEGNNLFKSGDVEGAISCYTKALKVSKCDSESAVLYRNRSACFLKLEEYSKAETDATKGKFISRDCYYREENNYCDYKFSSDLPLCVLKVTFFFSSSSGH